MQSMILVLLASFLQGIYEETGETLSPDGSWVWELLFCLVMIVSLIGVLISRYLVSQMDLHRSDEQWNRYIRTAHLLTSGYRYLILASFTGLLFVLHWPNYLKGLVNFDSDFLHSFLSFLPFAFMLLMNWILLYKFENKVRGGDWKFTSYLRFQSIAFVIAFPYFILLAALDLMELLPKPFLEEFHSNMFILQGFIFLMIPVSYTHLTLPTSG